MLPVDLQCSELAQARHTKERHNHRGAVQERSQGLSLRNPWIDSIDRCIPKGCGKRRYVSADRFSHPSGMQPFSQMQPGVSKTQPLATVFDASGVRRLPKMSLALHSPSHSAPAFQFTERFQHQI